MDRITATKEARLGALMQGGKWYVTCRRRQYRYMHEDRYRGSLDGAIVETFTAEKVRRTVPPDSKPKILEGAR